MTLRFDVNTGKAIKWPRIESPDEYMVDGSTRPLEDAARISCAGLIDWKNEPGSDRVEAYQALNQIGDCSVGILVDTFYSM